MPYLADDGILFVHIPKAAGSTVERFLGKARGRRWSLVGRIPRQNPTKGQIPEQGQITRFNPDRVRNKPRQSLRQHLVLEDIVRLLGQETVERCERFCVVRNPWDRLVSFYEYGRQTGGRMQTAGLSFREWFVTRLITPRLLPYIKVDGVGDPGMRCLRFERFDAEFGEYVEGLGLHWRGQVHEKKTRRGDYRTYYTDKMADALYEECREDIEHFGYRFDWDA
jgi:hypothetical protein